MTGSVDIVLTIDSSFTGTSLINWAEISGADDDMNSTNGTATDIDSTPDDDNTNDA